MDYIPNILSQNDCEMNQGEEERKKKRTKTREYLFEKRF
jgi:hypothetical protein